MNFKILMKKIFVSTTKFFKDGIKFWLESYEEAYKSPLFLSKDIITYNC